LLLIFLVVLARQCVR